MIYNERKQISHFPEPGGGGITMGQQKFLQVRDMFTLNYEGGMHYIKSYKTFDIMQKL